MAGAADHLPDDSDALKAALIETRAKLVGAQAVIEHLQLVIAKMQREKFGPRSEKSQRLIDQLELQLEEVAAAAARVDTECCPVRRSCRPGRSVCPIHHHGPAGGGAHAGPPTHCCECQNR